MTEIYLNGESHKMEEQKNLSSEDSTLKHSGKILPDVIQTENDSKNCDGCVRLVLVNKPESSEHIGFNLTRSQWDPYPWVKTVDADSAAGTAGLRDGDCLLRVAGEDVVGLKISDVARLVKGSGRSVQLLVWSSGPLTDWNPEALFCGPLPGALGRLGSCVAGILRALECPICVSTVRPPAVQCSRGHVLCAPCRAPLAACPICRTALGAAGGPPLRNLLADEVYNCVVEAFELQGDKAKSKLTQNLFGDAKFIKREPKQSENGETAHEQEFPAHDMTGTGLKWGTQKLLQRLLPGRARSTGNIARATRASTRDMIFLEDRDISRSLSTLDIARESNRNESNSLNSLACTAGGSCASLPPTNFHSSTQDITRFDENDNSNTDNEEITKNRKCNQYINCPADQNCRVKITGDLHQHILKAHGVQLTLRAEDRTNIEPSSRECCQALLHSTGHWFYPKCERDESDGGVRVWCWTCDDSSVSSQYQLGVEVWSDKQDVHCDKKRSLSLVDETPEVNSESEIEEKIKEVDKKKSFKKYIQRPLLKLAAPVLSLKNVSWSRVLTSKQSLFLGDPLLGDNATISISIDKID
ncbi:uncharacterized protein LOC143910099 [Arctopsyche grandis]|uniref:uncharacterized protein LOC143910099 n=1 Tax=Arctopsyche grandis TaxID=121162 RepID=UPI00406D7637